MRAHALIPPTRLSHRAPLWGLAGGVVVPGFLAGRRTVRRLREMRFIARQQAALRRVTTLATRGAPAAEIFDTVAGELGRVLAAENMIICRSNADDTCVVVASWTAGGAASIAPVNVHFRGRPFGVVAEVLRTGRPARKAYSATQLKQIYQDYPGARQQSVRSGAGCPIMVEGRLWGVLASFFARREPDGVEARMLGFLELIAAAIANAESRAELAASRARVVAAADASRRRIERDLHDGAQQRLIRIALETRMAADLVRPGQEELREKLSGLSVELTGALDDLREISHGLHPAILSRGGLEPALAALARGSAVPVTLDVNLDRRHPESVEVAVYYVVSEALANAAKHAGASLVQVSAHVGEDGQSLTLTIGDDGAGGADPSRGQGIVGLRDRVEAVGGRLDISSPPGRGTTLTARIPIKDEHASGTRTS